MSTPRNRPWQTVKCAKPSVTRGPDLLFQRHDQDAPDFEEALHVLLVLFLHACPAVHPVILRTSWRKLQAIAGNEAGFTEVKPEAKHVFHNSIYHIITSLHGTSTLNTGMFSLHNPTAT